MLNELSDYFFLNKIYDNIRIDNEGSLEQDNKFTFDQQIHRPINYKSSNLAYVPFVFDWVKNINSIIWSMTLRKNRISPLKNPSS